MMETKRKLSADMVIGAVLCGIIVLFLAGIVWVNLNPEQWYNFDIYADAMVAKYISESKSLFPEGWTFGNQFYTVATPVLAAVIYTFYPNTVAALGIASCLMTLLTLLSFWWCVKPFAKPISRIAGVFCLAGGTIFSIHAAMDRFGLQLFYTMASYYACYLIGIFVTMGVWLRLLTDKKVSLWWLAGAVLLNLALGVQSLREMLVLNLPLCAVTLCVSFLNRKSGKAAWLSKANLFALAMLAANFLGILLIRVLTRVFSVDQFEILGRSGASIQENIRYNAAIFLDYIGLEMPGNAPYSWFRFGAPVALMVLVLFCLVDIIRTRKAEPVACMIVFCAISLAAVFCAGVLIIFPRAIYYFVWHILVALSFVYVVDKLHQHPVVKSVLLVALIFVGCGNLFAQFVSAGIYFDSNERYYEQIADTLLDNGITHVYYDESTIFNAPRIAAYADDRIICAAFHLNPADTEGDDLLNNVKYLCAVEWFDAKSYEDAYIMLSAENLEMLEREENKAYAERLFSCLTLEHHIADDKRDYYFYSFSEELFSDMVRAPLKTPFRQSARSFTLTSAY